MEEPMSSLQHPHIKTIPIESQRIMWNAWNALCREESQDDSSLRQAMVVRNWLERLERSDLDILEVGCGAGWLSPYLVAFGKVTGTDLADELIARASLRQPDVCYVADDFLSIDLPPQGFDIVVTLEVLSHVSDQQAFLEKIAFLLRPGGILMLGTQNRPILERFMDIPPPLPGQIRRWVDRGQLEILLQQNFDILELFTVSPRGYRGFMRIVNSPMLNRLIRLAFGDRYDRLKERLGYGWTLMAMAKLREIDT